MCWMVMDWVRLGRVGVDWLRWGCSGVCGGSSYTAAVLSGDLYCKSVPGPSRSESGKLFGESWRGQDGTKSLPGILITPAP